MVVSAGWIAMNVRRRRSDRRSSGSITDWFDQARQRWQRDR
jgi:hypothetical protein